MTCYTTCRPYNGFHSFQVIRIIGNTLAPFDETGTIRGFGFGDSVTKDTSVFELDPQVGANPDKPRGVKESAQWIECVISLAVVDSADVNVSDVIKTAIQSLNI